MLLSIKLHVHVVSHLLLLVFSMTCAVAGPMALPASCLIWNVGFLLLILYLVPVPLPYGTLQWITSVEVLWSLLIFQVKIKCNSWIDNENFGFYQDHCFNSFKNYFQYFYETFEYQINATKNPALESFKIINLLKFDIWFPPSSAGASVTLFLE